MPLVKVPTSMRGLSANRAELEVRGGTLDGVLAELECQCPGIRSRLIDDRGELRRFLNIYVGAEDIRFRQKLQTPVGERDVVSIVQSIAGG